MNYPESKLILSEIKKAKRILINCHKFPDPDSIGAALALDLVLTKIGKSVKVICPTELYDAVSFLPNYQKMETVDFSTINYSNYDLFLVLDSSSWDFATGLDNYVDIPIIVIDHHRTNQKYGKINLVDKKMPSTCEILYLVFQDWKVDINKDIATALLTGIIGDTGAFRFASTTPTTLEIARALMRKGADNNKIIFDLYSSIEFVQFKFWSKVLEVLQFDRKYKFVWAAIPYQIFEKFGGARYLKESSASMFFQSVKGTDFGVIMVEEEKGKLNVSLRSRTGFDVSKIAVELGGGGHRGAAGGGVKGLPFDKAVKNVLSVCRKYAKQK